jgi:O-acetyl-ADP-ribose deacetylase (regulator of RNase III)
MSVQEHLEAIRADITTLDVDAIVNAANNGLYPGGGVDGAIRRAAGPELTEKTHDIGHCDTGSSVITEGYRLPAKFVIHTVAPIWEDTHDRGRHEELLASCYASAMKMADERHIESIAFPCIGTGIYSWPAERAARVAFRTVVEHLRHCRRPHRVVFCCFSEEDRARYQAMIDGLEK